MATLPAASLQPQERQLLGKLQLDVCWNLASLAVVGASGMLLNVLIQVFYGPATLGVFNQVFAAYIVFAQVASGGVHFSVLKHVAQHAALPARCSAIIRAALLLLLVWSAASAAAFWAASGPIGRLMQSDALARGIVLATPGLFFFAFNKTLLAALNGFRRMKMFAAVQTLRVLLLAGTALGLSLAGASGASLPLALTVAEVVLFGVGTLCIGSHLFVHSEAILPWIRRHLAFGSRSCGSAVVMELNTRVDVLMLGYFASDALVGIFSFAAILAEGFFQVLIVLRNNINPILVRMITDRAYDELAQFTRKVKLASFALMGSVGLIATLAFPLLVHLVSQDGHLAESWRFFAILMTGIVLAAGHAPFSGILLQAGRPGVHTLMLCAVLLVNVVLNCLLVPFWFATGAAIATAVSFVFSVAILLVLTKRVVGIWL